MTFHGTLGDDMQLEIFVTTPDDKRERAVYTSKPFTVHVEPQVQIRVSLYGMFGRCTKCGELKPASHFGMLTEDNTKRPGRPGLVTVRNQPQCKLCR